MTASPLPVAARGPSPVPSLALALALLAPAAAPAAPTLHDTGIVLCRDADGRDGDACAGTGQDGAWGRDRRQPHPADGRAGFAWRKLGPSGEALDASAPTWDCVQDLVTGLTWEVKTADGRLRDVNITYTNWGDGRPFDASTFIAAVNAQGLCGAGDWRLPTALELQGLLDYAVTAPRATVDTPWWPNTRAGWTWASDDVAGSTGEAWGANFGRGDVAGAGSRSSRLPVRLVRGEPAAPRWRLRADTALDLVHGLQWRRCAEGQAWTGRTCVGTPQRFTWREALAHAQASGWRLPDAKALASLLDTTRASPSIDLQRFPGTAAERHWTSSPVAGQPEQAWTVSFSFGAVDSRGLDEALPVRLVRPVRRPAPPAP